MHAHKKLVIHFIWILFAVLIGVSISNILIKGVTLAYGGIYDRKQEMNTEETTSTIPQDVPISSDNKITNDLIIPKTETTVSIGFVGDIVPGTNASENIFSGVVSYTEKPDLMIGNFEGVTTDNEYFKCKTDSLNCFSFNGDDIFLKQLSLASFDVLNIANNHFNDYGQIGQEETLREIQKAGIIASGIKNQITYITKNDFKIGIIGFSSYYWTTDMNNTENLKNIIKEAKQNSDIVIIIFHGGGEGINYAHTPNETEIYLGENRGNVRDFGQKAIDAGADIVLGSGPHVLRGIENYKGKLIAYSLGNFASANTLSTYGPLKISAILEATFKKNGSFVSGKILPFEIDAKGIPHPDSGNTGISAINELSKSDFGQQGIILNSSGEIKMQ